MDSFFRCIYSHTSLITIFRLQFLGLIIVLISGKIHFAYNHKINYIMEEIG